MKGKVCLECMSGGVKVEKDVGAKIRAAVKNKDETMRVSILADVLDEIAGVAPPAKEGKGQIAEAVGELAKEPEKD